MAESRDTEITLGVGKLLGLFFLLVVLCAVTFGLGYTFGRNSTKQQASLVADPPASAASAAVKTIVTKQQQTPASDRADCPNGQNCQQNGMPSSQDLSFYKAVEQKDANAKLTPAETSKPASSAPVTPKASPQASPKTPASSAASQPSAGTGYMVQVAAVTKREDAEFLQDALRRKQYPVLITSTAGDRFFHVQIGPFVDAKQAETIKARLVSDGYNPILKR